jgi:hypothetical protein
MNPRSTFLAVEESLQVSANIIDGSKGHSSAGIFAEARNQLATASGRRTEETVTVL